MEILDSFGRRGRAAGEFHWLHKFVVDSQGNIYTGEVHMQRRLQKFRATDEPDDRVGGCAAAFATLKCCATAVRCSPVV